MNILKPLPSYGCPHCGSDLRRGVREVRHNVTEVHHFASDQDVRRGGWHLSKTESECFGDIEWECG